MSARHLISYCVTCTREDSRVIIHQSIYEKSRLVWKYNNQLNITVTVNCNKMKTKNTTLSEQFQQPIEKS